MIEDYVELVDPEDLEMEADEQEILDATSRHSNALSADPVTPIDMDINNHSLGHHYYYSKS